MKNKTLAFKLVAGGIMAVFIPLLVVGMFSALRSSTALQEGAETQAALVARNLATTVQVALQQELKNAQSIGADPLFAGTDSAAMSERLMALAKKIGGDYEVFFIADKTGLIHADSTSGTYVGTNIGDRQYFTDARNGRHSVGTPVKSRVSGNPVAVVAVPLIGHDKQFAGILAATLKIDFLVNAVTDVRIGRTGYAWMVARSGDFIAHPRKELILDLNIKNIQGMEEITRHMLAGEAGIQSYVFEGIPKLAGYAPVALTGWSVAFTQDAPEFLAAAKGIRNIIAAVALAFLIVMALGFYFFSRTITVPIQRIIAGLSDGADEVASASGQVTSASQSLAEGASEQAASIEETSAAFEEMSSMTKQNADNARQADSLMSETRQVVIRANESMNRLTGSMADISSASDETSKIVKTIDEIAFQTNLLALNAAVEAARAGEAGAGFAVVADEVRNLAMRAAEAAKNTAALIEGTVKKVKEGSDLVSTTNEDFRQVGTAAEKVAELLGEIAAASAEQATGIGEVNKGVAEMDKVTQMNAANAEETASAAEELNAQAEHMQDIVRELAALVEGGAKHRVAAETSAKPRQAAHRERKAATGRSAQKATQAVESSLSRRKERPERMIPLHTEEFKEF